MSFHHSRFSRVLVVVVAMSCCITKSCSRAWPGLCGHCRVGSSLPFAVQSLKHCSVTGALACHDNLTPLVDGGWLFLFYQALVFACFFCP